MIGHTFVFFGLTRLGHELSPLGLYVAREIFDGCFGSRGRNSRESGSFFVCGTRKRSSIGNRTRCNRMQRIAVESILKRRDSHEQRNNGLLRERGRR